MNLARRLAHVLLGFVLALSLPVFGHRKHETPRCDRQPGVKAGELLIKRFIRCAASSFGVDMGTALRVAECESGFGVRASNDGDYLGIYQHDVDYWPTRARERGFVGHSAFEPVANIFVTMKMVASGGWGPWSCA